MGIRWFMDWEFVSFTPMIVYPDQRPWSQQEVDSAYPKVVAAAHERARLFVSTRVGETEIEMVERERVPEVRGFLGFGSQPGYTKEHLVVRRPGGWRMLRRVAYHNFSDCGIDWPRHRLDEIRCDEAWLLGDGTMAVAMINYMRYGRCPYCKEPVPLSHDLFEERLRPATHDDLLSFDISYDGGILGRDKGYGRHDEFRPHTGEMRFSPRPFTAILDALRSMPEGGDPSIVTLW